MVGSRPIGHPTAPRSPTRSTACEQPDSGAEGEPGLAIADADGSNVQTFGFAASGPWHPGARSRSLRPDADADPPRSPGPSALAYWNDGDVYIADADGSNAVRIADGVPDDGSNDNCADGEQYAQYAAAGTVWSPDGRYLAYWDMGARSLRTRGGPS